jgi:DNA-directed RNA polymerase subunit RPC12/RpoP
MMEILEKVAYMKGLAEGLGLDTKSKEGKLLKVIMDILDDIALELQDIHAEQGELEEGLDAVSDDLADVETYLYEQDSEDDEDDGEVYQTTCPNCQEDVFFDEDILADGSILCPNCGEKLEFDLEEPDGCGGGCCGACAEPAAEDGEDDNG